MINKELNSQLREKFNPEGSLLRRHQLRMLEMLKYIDKICKENRINYMLSSGTCLGAIRHGGFIPWDDDVDIEMLREDYIKFEKIMMKEDLYDFQTHSTDDFYIAPYAKIRDKKSFLKEHGQDNNYKYKGIYIDVFILEPGKKFPRTVFTFLMSKLLRYGAKLKKNNLMFKSLKRMFYMLIAIIRPIDNLLSSNNILRHTYGSGFGENIRYRDKLFPLKDIKFEDSFFPVPNDVDLYLSKLYGKDYNIIPDLNSIHPHVTQIEIN